MKIKVTLEDLTNGFKSARFRQNTTDELKNAVLSKTPIQINQQTLDGKRISLVFPTDLTSDANSMRQKFVFSPLWNRTFKVCSGRTGKLRALVIELACGKYQVDADGIQKFVGTTEGAGCDPADVSASETELGALIHAEPSNPVVMEAVKLIRKSF